MKFLAMLTIRDEAKNSEVRPAHLQYAADLQKAGKVFAAGPFLDRKGGLIIYEAENRAEAEKLAQADPAVASGARTVEVIDWEMLLPPIR